MTKTISLPLSLVQAIADEGYVMKKDFSTTVVVLVRIGIAHRREEERKEREAGMNE